MDYRERLSPKDFATFVRLRDVREAMAQEEALPVDMVFTKDPIPQIVRAKVKTKAALETIDGVGASRLEK